MLKKMHIERRALIVLLCLGILSISIFPCRALGENTPGEPQPALPAHVCYEVFVRSFFDGSGDGIGDLEGVIRKLDYICGPKETGSAGGSSVSDAETVSAPETGLGCDMIWLMPVFPSPTYHKYDVTDYLDIDSQYGTLDDMDRLIAACHERGVRLILDLPVNHTSTEHPWFREAAQYLSRLEEGEEPDGAACPYVDYYCFSREAKDGYAPLQGTNWFYEARFWEGMPDLDLDCITVRGEIEKILAFWQDRGIDGFRLDAVTSYYTQSREKSIAFVEWLNRTAKEKDPDCYLVGEAWSDRDTYLLYYESGIDSMFDFAFAGQEGMIASVARGNKPASWYVQKMEEEEELIRSHSDLAVNAPFYTNHDMARSVGYYPADGGARTKFALALNLLMPGNAFLYYGEELGMSGSGKDENKRAPMLWSSDPAAEGMCDSPPGMDEVRMMYPALDEQMEDPSSIFSCVRDVIALRKRYPAIACGRTGQVPELTGRELGAFTRTMPGEASVMIVVNASDQEQRADLSLLPEDSAAQAALSAAASDGKEALTLTPYAIAVIGEGDEAWTLINEGCVLPEKKASRRRK